MTTPECAQLVARLFRALPNRLREPAEAQVVYVDRLERFAYADLAAAVNTLLDTERELPPIADVIATLAALARERAEHASGHHVATLAREHEQRRSNGAAHPDDRNGR